MKNNQAKKLKKPAYSNEHYGAYSFEAHHAISGNQALKGHVIEQWIWVQRGKIEKDTGYSVNNPDNGTWQPSIPEQYMDGTWGPLSPAKKQAIAKLAMDAGLGQFHKGPHNILDPNDPDGEYHKTYDKELKRLLNGLNGLIHDWSRECFVCKPKGKGKLQPNWKVNEMLDRLSQAIIRDLNAKPCEWYYFISKIALEYHRPVCSHIHGKR